MVNPNLGNNTYLRKIRTKEKIVIRIFRIPHDQATKFLVNVEEKKIPKIAKEVLVRR